MSAPEKNAKKTASGHRAGVHSASSFGVAERALKRERQEEMASIPGINKAAGADGGGGNEDTVYRDKRGKKLDMLNEFMKQQNAGDGQKKMVEEAEYEWGRGRYDKCIKPTFSVWCISIKPTPIPIPIPIPHNQRAEEGCPRQSAGIGGS
jgi:hypothetical protein